MSKAKSLYGVFPIYKPSGYTTNAIMKMIRSSLGIEQISHSGALHSYSEGIMVLGVGKAVKYSHAIREHDRMYLIRGTLGIATSSFDATGDYTKVCPYYKITEKMMKEALNELYVGKIKQIQPLLPSFRFLQRERSKMSLVPRLELESEISKIDLIDFEPPNFQLHLYSKGRVYPSTIINDLGATLDSAAHLTHLCRVQQGDFGFREALHYYNWNEKAILNNLYLPSNDPDLKS